MTTTALVVSFVALLLGLAIGALAALAVGRARQASQQAEVDAAQAQSREQAAQAQAEVERARSETERVRGEVAQARLEAEQARSAASELRAHQAETQTQVAQAQVERQEAETRAATAQAALRATETQRDAYLNQIQQLQADSERMTKEFKALSAESLKLQSREADANHEARLKATEAMLAPVAQQLKDFSDRLAAAEKERVAMAAELREQVNGVVSTSEHLRRETSALTTALRKPQVRGTWGEMQLRKVVELAGMVEHCDFVQQETSVNATDATIRPDMKVLFTEEKFVYVDSKVPLSAFLDAQEATDDAEQRRLLAQFGKNVRGHVDQLSAKEYWKVDTGTPEFVVLFMPTEALYAEATRQLPDLAEYAATRHVVLATPTTLIALLRTIQYSWRQAKLAESAGQIFALARELNDRLAIMGERFDKLGRTLTSAVKAYNDTVGTVEGRVLPTARKFRELQVSEREIKQLSGVQETIRSVAAPELLSAERDASDDADALAELERRPTPSTDELAADGTVVRALGSRKRLA